MGVSVIIPAYKASNFIEKCLNSIKSTIPFEIIVGIDGCQETLDVIKGLKFGIRDIYFSNNVGPYAIKNSLVMQAKYENLLFFDADDIMAENLIEKVEEGLQKYDYLKFNYIEFSDKINHSLHPQQLPEGIIAIKKNIFLKLNGFYPWRCAADSEFIKRLEFNKYRYKYLNGLCFYRRIHKNNLTNSGITAFGSKLRNSYVKEIQNRQRANNWPNP